MEMTHSFKHIKENITTCIEQVKSFGKLSEEQLNKLQYKFRLEWNYNSNSMEGNTLTKAETRSVMIGNLDVHRKPIKDVFELNGHDTVIHEILRIGKGILRLSETRIKQIHTAIMYEEDSRKREWIGQWKTEPNEIVNYKGEKQIFTLPECVADEIHNLLNRTNTAIDKIQYNKRDAPHPLDIAFDFHLEFLKIHPFYDGNGRTARILTNLILISLEYPPFWINDSERETYYRYITDIQSYGGSKEAFFTFLGELVLRSQNLILKVAEGEEIEEDDDLNKEIELLSRKLEGLKQTNPVVKSHKVITALYNQSLKDLITETDRQAKKFQKIFKQVEFNFFIVKSDKNHRTFHEKITYNYEELFKTINLEEIDGIVLSISFINLNNIERYIGLGIELAIDFYSESYKIHSNDVEYSIKKLYSETVDKVEIKKIVSDVVDVLKKQIKQEIDKETK